MQPTPSCGTPVASSLDGDGDDEHFLARKRTKIQSLITACVDVGIQQALLRMHDNEGSWGAHTLLAELSNAEHLVVAAQLPSRLRAGARGLR